MGNPARSLMIVAIVAIAGLSSCKKAPQSLDDTSARAEPAAAVRTPSATEVFQLRSECAALGQKILDGNMVGSALTQSVVSRYNPTTNRCYVDLTVMTADLSMSQTYFSRTLYDGQTRELLAWTKDEKGKRFGTTFVDLSVEIPPGTDAFENVNAIINKVMADDRKR